MGIPELRNVLHDFINHDDERFLKMVYAMSKEYENSEFIGYNVDCTAITVKDLNNRVREASKRVKDGDYLTQEEIEKEINER